MAHQGAVTAARLGKGANATKVWNQRQHSCPWRRVEISLAAFAVGSLAHHPASTGEGVRGSQAPPSRGASTAVQRASTLRLLPMHSKYRRWCTGFTQQPSVEQGIDTSASTLRMHTAAD